VCRPEIGDHSFEGHEQMLRLYTDGSFSEESGVGSWAWLLVGGRRSEVGSGAVVAGATHMRMELHAAVEGLAQVPKRKPVEVVTDSLYLVDGMGLGLVEQWQARGWRSVGRGREIAHRDLWAALIELTAARRVTFTWVKAHNGDDADPWNVMADHLAKTARRLAEAA
jgi:ribonuclease HI